MFIPLKAQNYSREDYESIITPRDDYESIITPREDYGSIITPLAEC